MCVNYKQKESGKVWVHYHKHQSSLLQRLIFFKAALRIKKTLVFIILPCIANK